MIGGLYKIVHEEPPRLADAGAFDEVLRATMARDPAERWPMERVRDRLAQIRRDPSAAGVMSMTVVRSRGSARDPALRPVPALAGRPPDDRRKRRRGRGWRRSVLRRSRSSLVLAFTGDDPTTRRPTIRPPSRPVTRPTRLLDSGGQHRRDITDFITTYLATVTTDRRATYAMLTPEFQAKSVGSRATAGSGERSRRRAQQHRGGPRGADRLVRRRLPHRVGGSNDGSVTLQLGATGATI